MRKALLISKDAELALSIPYVLQGANFSCDIITTQKILTKIKCVSSCRVVDGLDDLVKISAETNLDIYDFIVISDDETLKAILDSAIPLSIKLKLLPVNAEENLQHLCSKIGLSQVLLKANVDTPNFEIANNFLDLKKAANKIQYPIISKLDFSGGSYGLMFCESEDKIDEEFLNKFPGQRIVQKKIEGIEIDLSALYLQGNLIHFSYSEVKKTFSSPSSFGNFGPSILRHYYPLSSVGQEVFIQMQKLGKALGANGFVNVSAIKSIDGKTYFIEADMRPNVWVNFTKFFGENISKRIDDYFSKGEILKYPQPFNYKYPQGIVMPYILRMNTLDILLNRYNVWKYSGFINRKIIVTIFCEKKLMFYEKKLKKFPTKLSRSIIRNNNLRQNIKQKLFFLNLKKLINC